MAAPEDLSGGAGGAAGAAAVQPGDVSSGALEALALLRGLAAPLRAELAAIARVVHAAPGRVLVRREVVSPALWVVVSGRVAPLPGDGGAAHARSLDLGAGAVVGAGLLTGESEAVTLGVPTPTDLLELPGESLVRVLDAHPEARLQLATRASLWRRREELAGILHRAGPFAATTPSQVRWLVETATLVPVTEGERICEEGDESDTFYFVVKGEVAIEQRIEGVPGVVAVLQRGDCFGEMGVLTGRPRAAAATATRTGELLVIGRRELDSVVRESDQLRRALWSLTAERSLVRTRGARATALRYAVVDRTGAPPGAAAALLRTAIEQACGEQAAVSAPAGPATRALLVPVARADEEVAMSSASAELDGAVVLTIGRLGELPRWASSIRTVHRIAWTGATATARLSRDERGWELLLPRGAALPSPSLDGYRPEERRALGTLARALLRRTVGVALGGGAAWGYGHVALLRGLARAGIPVDAVAGVSFGSIAGALYADRGLEGLEHLVARRRELAAVALACTVSTTAALGFVRRHVRARRIEELSIPYRAVAVDIRRGAEHVFAEGEIAGAIRASCALPGVFATTRVDGVRYVDACVKNNVPASHLSEMVDFVIGSNVVPPPSPEEPSRWGDLASSLSPIQRVRDGLRAIYVLGNDAGRRQTRDADATFCPDLADFIPTDFLAAPEIVAAAERQLAGWLDDVKDLYAAVRRGTGVR